MQLLDVKAITELTTISATTIRRMVKDNKFPQPAKVRSRDVWSSKEVHEWIDNLLKESKQ